MASDNVTDNLKPSLSTTSGKVFIAAVLAGPLIVIGYVVLANRLLPAEDAQAFKAPIFALWATVGGTSGIGLIVSSLLSRWGKITTQKAIAVQTTAPTKVPENVTAGGDVVMNAPPIAKVDTVPIPEAPKPATMEDIDWSNFDISETPAVSPDAPQPFPPPQPIEVTDEPLR